MVFGGVLWHAIEVFREDFTRDFDIVILKDNIRFDFQELVE